MHDFHTNVLIDKSIKRTTADDDFVASKSPQMARHSPQLCGCIKHDGLSLAHLFLESHKKQKMKNIFIFSVFAGISQAMFPRRPTRADAGNFNPWN